jgi:hypothetical protein
MSGQYEQSLMDGEVKERQRYWEERIRAGQRRGSLRNAPAEGTFPETPDLLQNGNVDSPSERENAVFSEAERFQAGLAPGNVAQAEALQEVEDEIAALRQRRRGNVPPASNFRPGAIDDFARGRLVTLLAMGLSIRQAAAAVGVSHTAVRKELKRNPELTAQLAAAREHARLEPLLVIIRESKRSWRAATWLMKYLDGKERKGSGRRKEPT